MSLLLRPALYYPHLQFTDLAWLKEALLSFRQIRRMAPGRFHVSEDDVTWELREQDIPGLGPMIVDESVDDVWPERAQQRVHDWLVARPPAALAVFDEAHTIARYGRSDTFQMHPGKFMASMLMFLEQHALVWTATQPSENQSSAALALHPRLGEAIMAIMAIAIAERKQLNIVTSEPRVHRALLTRREEDVLASLTDDDATEIEPPGSRDVVTSATQLLIHKHLDLSWVSLEDVAAIVKDGNDFQRFRVRLQQLATELGLAAIPDPVEQAKQIEALAAAARKEWETYRRGLGSFAKMYVATALDDKTEAAIAAGVPALAGLSSLGMASVGVGLAIGALTIATKSLRKLVERRKNDPYRYLSRLTQHGATLIADFEARRELGAAQRK